MKILRKGKVKPVWYVGECSNCGCIVRITEDEGEWEEDRGQDHLTLWCPTKGCRTKLYFKEKNGSAS